MMSFCALRSVHRLFAAIVAAASLAGCTSWATVEKEARRRPADLAWTYIDDKADNGKIAEVGGRLIGLDTALEKLGLDSLSANDVAEKARERAENTGTGLSKDATEQLARDFQRRILAEVMAPSSDVRKWALYVEDFAYNKSGGRSAFELDVQRLNRLLVSSLQNDAGWREKVTVVALPYGKGLDYVRGETAGVGGDDGPVQFAPEAILLLGGNWSAFFEEGKDEPRAQTLEVVATITLTSAQKRQYMSARDFSARFVYHPVRRWISIEEDERLRTSFNAEEAEARKK